MTDLPPPPGAQPPSSQPQVVYVEKEKKGGCLKGGILTILILGALFVGLIVVAVVALSSGSDDVKTSTTTKDGVSTGFGSKDASKDAGKVTCTNEPTLDIGQGTVMVTNHSSGRSNYYITVAAESADGTTQIDTGYASLDKLEPGQKSEADVLFTKALPEGTVCKVTEVSRTASN